MGKKLSFDRECSLFSSKRLEDIAILRFKKGFLFHIIDLRNRDTLLAYLDHISKTDSIKVVVIIGCPDKAGSEEYIRFYHQVIGSSLGITSIQRVYNVVDQFILRVVDLNKIVVHANRGKVISLFFNMSLACDYRIVTDNTVFQNPYLDLGTVPKGGGAFFLSKMLGASKAYEILLSSKDLTAHEALRLGIVDKVVPVNEFEETVMDVAHTFARKPRRTLEGIKKFLNNSMKDLKENLELEDEEINKIISNSDFWKELR